MSNSYLSSLEIETAANPTASVIWMHGLGADGHDFEPIVPELGLPDRAAIRFVFPHAPAMPVTINGGYIMPAWYDISEGDLGIKHDEAGIKQSAHSIRMLIERETMRGIKPENVVLAGFSQGAAMALHVGLHYEERLAGIIALSGYLLLPERVREIAAANRTTPILMAHGVQDPVVPFGLGEASYRRLQQLGAQVEWHAYPMEHHVCAEEVQQVGKWLTDRLAGPA